MLVHVSGELAKKRQQRANSFATPLPGCKKSRRASPISMKRKNLKLTVICLQITSVVKIEQC